MWPADNRIDQLYRSGRRLPDWKRASRKRPAQPPPVPTLFDFLLKELTRYRRSGVPSNMYTWLTPSNIRYVVGIVVYQGLENFKAPSLYVNEQNALRSKLESLLQQYTQLYGALPLTVSERKRAKHSTSSASIAPFAATSNDTTNEMLEETSVPSNDPVRHRPAPNTFVSLHPELIDLMPIV